MQIDTEKALATASGELSAAESVDRSGESHRRGLDMELTLEDRIDYYLLSRLVRGGLAAQEDRLIRRCIKEMKCVREEVDRRIAFLIDSGLAEASATEDSLIITKAGREYLSELERLHGWSGGAQ